MSTVESPITVEESQESTAIAIGDQAIIYDLHKGLASLGRWWKNTSANTWDEFGLCVCQKPGCDNSCENGYNRSKRFEAYLLADLAKRPEQAKAAFQSGCHFITIDELVAGGLDDMTVKWSVKGQKGSYPVNIKYGKSNSGRIARATTIMQAGILGGSERVAASEDQVCEAVIRFVQGRSDRDDSVIGYGVMSFVSGDDVPVTEIYNFDAIWVVAWGGDEKATYFYLKEGNGLRASHDKASREFDALRRRGHVAGSIAGGTSTAAKYLDMYLRESRKELETQLESRKTQMKLLGLS